MAADLIIATEAEGDLDEGYTWYEEQRIGRGEARDSLPIATASGSLKLDAN